VVEKAGVFAKFAPENGGSQNLGGFVDLGVDESGSRIGMLLRAVEAAAVCASTRSSRA
jgi:hypothetical protein